MPNSNRKLNAHINGKLDVHTQKQCTNNNHWVCLPFYLCVCVCADLAVTSDTLKTETLRSWGYPLTYALCLICRQANGNRFVFFCFLMFCELTNFHCLYLAVPTLRSSPLSIATPALIAYLKKIHTQALRRGTSVNKQNYLRTHTHTYMGKLTEKDVESVI